MKVKELFDKFVGDFISISIFENDNKVEDFYAIENSDTTTTSYCQEKYGDRVVADWYYNCGANILNIDLLAEDFKE